MEQKEDKVVLSLAEYRELTNKAERLEDRIKIDNETVSRRNQEIIELKLDLEKAQKENIKLKKGIINYVKMLGETNG